MSKSSPFKDLQKLLLTSLLTFFFINAWPVDFQQADSIAKKPRILNAEDLIRGERLFYGLVSVDNNPVNCASCHNTVVADTMNWNPDAVEISKKYLTKSVEDLSRVLLNPSGQKMSQVHKNFKFTPEDVELLKAYMNTLSKTHLVLEKPVITNLILFLIASLFFLLSFIDLIITKKLKKQWINLVVIGISLVYITWILVVDAIALGRSHNYSPDQPVKFSHQIHAGQNATRLYLLSQLCSI